MIRSLTITISSTSGEGPQGELEVVFSRWDEFGSAAAQRPEFQYAIRCPGFGDDAEGTMAYGHDLRLGGGDDIDHVKAMECLLTFLQADAEKYAAQLRSTTNTSAEAVMQRTGDTYLFNEKTAEWAYELSEELAYAEQELRDEAGDEPARELALATEALDAIARELSGVSWNADTVERVAAIVGATGRQIEDVADEPFGKGPSDHPACIAGSRERAQYGNVHDENEGR